MKKIIIMLLCLVSISFGQYGYWGHYLLEKGYEDNQYFLQPHRALTMQMEGIGEEMLGLFPDTLANMSFNPALLANISKSRFYIDFANQKPEQPTYSYASLDYDYAVNSSFMPPYYQTINTQEINPLLRSIGVFQSDELPITLGFAYELINYTGEYFDNPTYYPYRMYDSFGSDVGGVMENQSPEIRQSGEDTKDRIAHMIDFYTAWQFRPSLSAGIKLSYSLDINNGTYKNFHQDDSNNEYEYDYENYYDNDEVRYNKVKQYEITTGINYHTEKTSVGISGGWIVGEDNQKREKSDTSYYFYDYEDYNLYDCFNRSENRTEYDESWKHSGNTGFLSLNGNRKIEKFNLLYRMEYLINSTDIDNSGLSLDSNYYEYNHYYEYQSDYYQNRNNSGNHEIRTGHGKLDQSKKTIGFAIQTLENGKTFSLGFIYQEIIKDKNLIENSEKNRNSKSSSNQDVITNWLHQSEDVDIKFTGNENISLVKIPISFVLRSKNGLKFRTTLTKIIGKQEREEEILIKYNDYFYRDLTQNPVYENTDQNDELFIASPVRKTIDRIQLQAYLEYDYSPNITISILFSELFTSKGHEYEYYYDEPNLINIGNWKFGVGFKF